MSSAFERIRKSLGLDRQGQEAAQEFPAGTVGGRTRAGSAGDYQLGPDDGVRISPMPVTALSEVTISYGGLLAKSGAEKIYLHCGDGPGEWRNVRDIPMKRGQAENWYAELEVGEAETFEFCFHDGSGGWDNNNGANWSVTVHDGRNPH